MALIIFILTLTLLVVIHELGHFLMAKKFGVKVLEFGFGIPPRIWGKKIGETLISINWLPIGGFVRLLGEDDDDPKVLSDRRSFSNQKVGKRIAIVVAGVVMNFLLSWLIFYAVIIYGNFKIIIPSPEPVIAIEAVVKGSPAETSGLKQGDTIISFNGEKVNSINTIQKDVAKNLGNEVTLGVVDSTGVKRNLIVTPRKNPPIGEGSLGIEMSPFSTMEFKTPLEKILSGPMYSLVLTKVTLVGTGTLLSEVVQGQFTQASNQVAGPVGIAVVSTSFLKNNLDAIMTYVYLVGTISLTLAVMNVLPIPALDGGRLLFLIIEAVTKKRVHPTTEKYVHAVGMIILLGLIVLITISDIRKFIF